MQDANRCEIGYSSRFTTALGRLNSPSVQPVMFLLMRTWEVQHDSDAAT